MVSMKIAVAGLAIVFVVSQVSAESKHDSQGNRRLKGGHGGNRRSGCEPPTRFPSFFTNATIAQLQMLWPANLTNVNCTAILEQEIPIIKKATNDWVAAQATNLSASAQTVFRNFQKAQNDFDAAPTTVQDELINFEDNIKRLIEGAGEGRGRGKRAHGGQRGQVRNGFSNRAGGNREVECQASTRYLPLLNNATVAQIQALYANLTGANCTALHLQEETITKNAIEQWVVAQAANLTPAAQPIFNDFKVAQDSFDTATPAVQNELNEFDMRIEYELEREL